MSQHQQGCLPCPAATPEKVVNAKRFIAKIEKLYKAGRLARIAIDEVQRPAVVPQLAADSLLRCSTLWQRS